MQQQQPGRRGAKQGADKFRAVAGVIRFATITWCHRFIGLENPLRVALESATSALRF